MADDPSEGIVGRAAVLSASYWHTFMLAVLGALVTALASFIQNISSFLPADPPQKARCLTRHIIPMTTVNAV